MFLWTYWADASFRLLPCAFFYSTEPEELYSFRFCTTNQVYIKLLWITTEYATSPSFSNHAHFLGLYFVTEEVFKVLLSMLKSNTEAWCQKYLVFVNYLFESGLPCRGEFFPLIIDLGTRWRYNTPFVLTVYLHSLTESPIKYCTVCGSAQLTSTLQGLNIYLSPDDPLRCIALTLHHAGSSWTGFSALWECRQCVERDRRRLKVTYYVK